MRPRPLPTPAVVNERPCRVRGRPIHEVSREALEAEVIRQREQIAALQESIRLNHTMWQRAMNQGAMTGNPAHYQGAE